MLTCQLELWLGLLLVVQSTQEEGAKGAAKFPGGGGAVCGAGSFCTKDSVAE